MTTIRLVLVMLSIVALTMCAKGNEAKPNNEAQSNVDMLTNKLESDLTAALKSIRVEPSADMPDLRWGTIFYGTDDARVASLYFDVRGTAGAVNKVPVAFRGDFFKWLERKFGDCFK